MKMALKTELEIEPQVTFYRILTFILGMDKSMVLVLCANRSIV